MAATGTAQPSHLDFVTTGVTGPLPPPGFEEAQQTFNFGFIPEPPKTLRTFEEVLREFSDDMSLPPVPHLQTAPVADINAKVRNNIPYERVSAFVAELIECDIILDSQRMRQVGMCENWSLIEFLEWEREIFESSLDKPIPKTKDLRISLDLTNSAWNTVPKNYYQDLDLTVRERMLTESIDGRSFVSESKIQDFVGKLLANSIIWAEDVPLQMECCQSWTVWDFLEFDESLPLFAPYELPTFTKVRDLRKDIDRLNGTTTFAMRASVQKRAATPTQEEEAKAPSRSISAAAEVKKELIRQEIAKMQAKFEAEVDQSTKEIAKILGTTPAELPRVHVSPQKTIIFGKDGTEYAFEARDEASCKVRVIKELIMNGVMTLYQLERFATPQLTPGDVWNYRSIYGDGVIEKPTIDVTEAVKKIDELVGQGKDPSQLEKYVALGILTRTELDEWRIVDQARNQYFYNDDFTEPDEMEEDFLDELEKTRPTLKEYDPKFKEEVTFAETLREDLTAAAYRVAATQAVAGTKALCLQALPADKAPVLRDFLDTEWGTAIISMMSGLALTYGMPDSYRAYALAEELRIQSMATVGNEIVDNLTSTIISVITDAVNQVPNEEEDPDVILEENIRTL